MSSVTTAMTWIRAGLVIDRFQAGLKVCMISTGKTGPRFRCGVLGVVRAGGGVAAGDFVRATIPRGPLRTLPAL